MQESTINSKGRTTLPKNVRAALGLGPGDQVRYLILDGDVRLLKVRSVAELAGMLAQGRASASPEDMDAAITAAAAKRSDPAA